MCAFSCTLSHLFLTFSQPGWFGPTGDLWDGYFDISLMKNKNTLKYIILIILWSNRIQMNVTLTCRWDLNFSSVSIYFHPSICLFFLLSSAPLALCLLFRTVFLPSSYCLSFCAVFVQFLPPFLHLPFLFSFALFLFPPYFSFLPPWLFPFPSFIASPQSFFSILFLSFPSFPCLMFPFLVPADFFSPLSSCFFFLSSTFPSSFPPFSSPFHLSLFPPHFSSVLPSLLSFPLVFPPIAYKFESITFQFHFPSP